MTVRVDDRWAYSGQPVVRIENSRLAADVLPGMGGKVLNLIDKVADRNVLWRNPRLPVRPGPIGVEWTFLRPTGFAKNTLGWAGQIADGVVIWPYGQAARPLIHEGDIAAVAAKALTEPGHDGKTYVLSGPEAVPQTEQVQIIGDAIGKQVRWREQTRAEARPALVATFGSEEFADRALDAWAGFITEPEPVTSTVREITGRGARTFAEWAREHADGFR